MRIASCGMIGFHGRIGCKTQHQTDGTSAVQMAADAVQSALYLLRLALPVKRPGTRSMSLEQQNMVGRNAHDHPLRESDLRAARTPTPENVSDDVVPGAGATFHNMAQFTHTDNSDNHYSRANAVSKTHRMLCVRWTNVCVLLNVVPERRFYRWDA